MEVKDYPPLFNTLKSTFKYCIQFWAPPSGKTEKLEQVQQKAPKLVGSGALALWGDAEGLGAVQPGDEMTLRGPDSSLPMPKMGLARTQSWATTVGPGESTRHSGLKWNEGRFWSDIRKLSPLWKYSSIGKVFPRRLCSLHPSRFSKSD